MSQWFRFYGAAMRHPKVLALSDCDFRLWIMLLTIASENDGLIPPLTDLKRLLKARLDHLSTALKRLLKGGLIDPLDDGYRCHNWEKYQYKSDTSTKRVQDHRQKRNVSATPPDTDTDTDISSLRSDIAPPCDLPDEKPVKPKRAKSKTAIDPNAQPTAADLDHARTAGVDARAEWPKFRDYHLANPKGSADWPASWRTWCSNSNKYVRAGPRGKINGTNNLVNAFLNLGKPHERDYDGPELELNASPG